MGRYGVTTRIGGGDLVKSDLRLIWCSAAEAARMLGCPPKQIPKLAARGLLTVRTLPGCAPRYAREDVVRLADATTRNSDLEHQNSAP